jgi:hypothetical protein
VLRRDLVSLEVLEPWLARLGASARPVAEDTDDRDPYRVAGDVQGFLRALHLQLAISARPPAHRADLLLAVIEQLRASNAPLLA